MTESPEVSPAVDRLREVAALRERGYTPEEITALLSDNQWLGNVYGDERETDLHLSGLRSSDFPESVRTSPLPEEEAPE